ncbi:MAG TPA: adenylate/guanylate cyclase domain-containing protein [Acidimicrobiales bacterium]|nr:adenylate/guanylate cyclase domain-containing protein [Acidimicrobiales bacterium]
MSGGDGWTCARCAGDNPAGTRFCGHCGAPESAPEPGELAAAAPQTKAATATAVLRSFVAGPLAERLERGALQDERRLVTSLFADLSGFTSLADRLDPEQLQEVIDPLIAMLSDVVARHEGYVDKYAGDALLAIFGAPVSHEDDAARALQVALEMHDELQNAAASLPLDSPLTLHVGVNSGHVVARVLGHQVRMDYAVVGDAVILAQRLESAASGGETYVGESTYRLTRDDFEFEALPPLTLKGKAEPVPAWRLLGRRAPRTRTGGEPAGSLIGREGELRRGEALLRAAVEGRGGVSLVAGEPGIGKTALTDELRRRAAELGVRWLDGRCISYGAALPYWPYVELLRSLLHIPAAQVPDRVGPRLAEVLPGSAGGDLVPYFERLLGLDPDGATDIEPEAFQRGLRRAFSALLEALADDRPTVVAIEDVHWMDSSSLALTVDLARLCGDHPLVLHVTGRSESADLLASIGDRVPADRRHRFELGPLGPDEAGALVRSIAHQAVPAAVQAAVAERTGGNPLFVEEVLRWLEETGEPNALSTDDIAELPPTVEGLLSARIDHLPSAAASVLHTASIIGRIVPLDLLEAVTGGADVGDLVGVLVQAGFLDSRHGEGRVVFHHPLVQETAYGRLLRRQRVLLHLRVADMAERLYGAGDDSLPLLARHLYLGASPKALAYLGRAAGVAKRLYANDEAIVHLRRAAEVAGRESRADVLPGILFDLADLLELRGHLEEAIEVYRRAGESGGDWRVGLGLASTLRKRGRFEEALATLDEAGAALPLSDPGHRALGLERARTLLSARRTGDAAEVLDRELGLVDGRSVPAGYLKLLLSRAEGHLDRALRLGEEAREILGLHDDHRGVVGALRNLGGIHCLLGEMDLAIDALREGIALGERMGNAEELAACLLNLGMVLSRRGEIDEAIDCDLRAIEELERMGHESGRVNGYANLASALARGGRHDEALAASERTLEAARRLGDEFAIADSYVTQATVHLAQGHPGTAARLAEAAAQLFERLDAGPPARDALDLAARAWDEDGQQASGEAARKRAGLMS